LEQNGKLSTVLVLGTAPPGMGVSARTGAAQHGPMEEKKMMYGVMVGGAAPPGTEMFAIPGAAPDGMLKILTIMKIIIVTEYGTVRRGMEMFAQHGPAQDRGLRD
jgi:hypothetical protein